MIDFLMFFVIYTKSFINMKETLNKIYEKILNVLCFLIIKI